jgi:hypothetical protein
MRQTYVKRAAAQLKVPEEAPEDSGVKYPDLMDEFNLLEWAGVSFGKSEVGIRSATGLRELIACCRCIDCICQSKS